MGPPNPWTYALERFAVFLRDVIEPAVFPAAAPLDAEAFQTPEPVPARDAFAAKYSPVKLGWQWGPRWSTAWFRLRGVVPASMAGRHVMLRFSTDTEALLWLPDASGTPVPHHGLDMNRDAVTLFTSAKGGERVELHVEAACNHMFGDRGLQWDPPEIHRRWNSQTPGLFERCELAVRDEHVWRLKHVYAFALDLARQMAPDSPRGQQLLGVLRRATNMLPDDAVARHAAEACALIESVLRPPLGGAAGSATLCHAVGHAHIDTAWLWPLRETKRKCLRTFSTVLRNMEADPDYRFLCSQAQQYEYVRERSPELFEQIKRRVADGRWEPGGAMWIEPDCTCPSGESLIRQCLYADRYWRHHFGDKRGAQRFLYLPDTFGFPAQLPQIMRHCGLDTFITNKLHWNSTNVFPHTTFLWRGLDGSTVLAHQTPGMDYNASNTPKELIRGEKTHKNKDLPGIDSHGARWLQPFGFGDGGGGPTDWSILYARLAQDCDALPRVSFSSATDFCDALHRDVQHALKHDPHAVPTHDCELYLELHRGTYTTHARIKQANAECEELLRQAEILTFTGPTRLPREQELSAKAELDKAWKLVLLNQFHDILPGSSITWVYEDAARDYAQVRDTARRLIHTGLENWSRSIAARPGVRMPVLVFNPSNAILRGVVEHEGRVLRAPDLYPLEACVIDAGAAPPEGENIGVATDTLDNGLIRVQITPTGEIVSLQTHVRANGHILPGRLEFAGPGPRTLNRLALFEDRPRLWDAWDIDAELAQKPIAGALRPESMSIIENSALRAVIRVACSMGTASRIEQDFILDRGVHHVTIRSRVEWRESKRCLRTLSAVTTAEPSFLCGTQLGYVRRPASRPHGPHAAMFEVPAQRWASVPTDINGSPASLALLFTDRYGVSFDGEALGLTLLRSPRYPDPTADEGVHEFTYALLPANGYDAWQPTEAAETLARPAVCVTAAKPPAGGSITEWGPLHAPADGGGIFVESIKPAEDDPTGTLIVRFSNPAGGGESDHSRTIVLPVRSAHAVDGLERPLAPDPRHVFEPGCVTIRPRAFEITSIALVRES